MSADRFDDARFARGLEELAAGRFHEAHEVLEDLWGDEAGDRKRFLQGLVQAAVGLHKEEIGEMGGARKLFRSALEILAAFPGDAFGIDLARFRADLAGRAPALAAAHPSR